MRLELVSIETDTDPLDGAFYEPEGGASAGAMLIMHGNSTNFYTGVVRVIPPLLVELGYACLCFNRRGHDIVISQNRRPSGGAFQRVHEMIADNEYAAEWLTARGHANPIVVGHSNGGMLAVRHCADNPKVRALVLLSAHMGGKDLFPTISATGLMAGDRFEEFSARARELVAAGKGSELMLVPGWWWVISAQTFVDYLDVCPDILELAPRVRCPVLFLRGDKEPQHIYPGEVFVERAGGPAEFALVSDCDHFYGGREGAAVELISKWLARSGIARAA
ncbi:MAG TPA: alpha/beta fold hydrolase [Xanthobacteraceae bacterium]|nr:alpha/beta fold hydrolase [Xanthobacteraceae bacterium]